MNPNPGKTTAGIYVRISQDAEEDGLGVDRQLRDCKALATTKGWHVLEVFTDNDVSATSGKPRPEYQRMTREVEAGRIQGVVVWDVDRLTRTPRELEDVIDWADRHGLQLASVGGEIDLATPQGRLTARLKGAVARHETEQSSRRIKRRFQQLAEQGQHRGQRPYGWNVTPDKQLVINPEEAAVVREAYARVLDGQSVLGIATRFNQQGIPTLKGKRWTPPTVRSTLKRWRNCGVSIYQGKEVGRGDWEPIVDRETHEQLLALLADPARRKNNRGTAVKYLLTNLVTCAECGNKLAGAKARTYNVTVKLANGPVKKPRHFPARYHCKEIGCQSVTRRMADLDEFVTEYIIGLMERDGVRLLGGDPEAATTARERIASLEAKMNLVADQFADDEITPDQFQRINGKLRPQLDAAHTALAQATPSGEGLAEFAGPGARNAWNEASLEQRRTVIKSLIDFGLKIVVSKSGQPYPRHTHFDPESVQITW